MGMHEQEVTRMEKPQLSEHAKQMFPDAQALINQGKCPLCKEFILIFRDKQSVKEYKISGMCQDCQDMMFGGN